MKETEETHEEDETIEWKGHVIED